MKSKPEPVYFDTLDAAYDPVMDAAIALFRAVVIFMQYQYQDRTERPTRAEVLEHAIKAIEGIADPAAFIENDFHYEDFYRDWVERDQPLPEVVEIQ